MRSFGRSLEETYLKLADQMAKRETLALIHSRVIDLERTPPKILDGVPETLAYLTERHRLILFTKGEPAEQAAKVERSGLQGFFEFIEIVAEKDPETYGGLVHKHKIVKSHGWMIGNSPRSDINPAMKIGLNAVFIPHQGLRKARDLAFLSRTAWSFLAGTDCPNWTLYPTRHRRI